VAYKYSQLYSRDSERERERIAEAKRNWSKNLTVKDSKNSYVIAVAIALTIASILLVTYFVALRPIQEPYMTIYLLDANKKAGNYPENLVANVNSTFSVFVDVENHQGQTVNETILMKVISDMNPTFPIAGNATQAFNATLKNGATTENIATVSLSQPGNYLVAFELWIQKADSLQFTGDFVDLNIQVIAATNSTTETSPTPLPS
jgi:uncharacterized membrane protein